MKKVLFSLFLTFSIILFGNNNDILQSRTQLLSHLKNTKRDLKKTLKQINEGAEELKEEMDEKIENGLYSFMYDVYHEFSSSESEAQLTQKYIQFCFNVICNDMKILNDIVKEYGSFDFSFPNDEYALFSKIFTKQHKKYCQKYPTNKILHHEITIADLTKDLYCMSILGLIRAHRLFKGLLEIINIKITMLEIGPKCTKC